MRKISENQKLNLTKQDSGSLYSFGISFLIIFSLFFSLISPLLSYLGSFTLLKIISYLCPTLSLLSAVLLLFYKNKSFYTPLLKPSKISFKVVIGSFLITFGLFFGLSELNQIFADFLLVLGYNPPPQTLLDFSISNFIISIIFVCFLPALIEELFFRGLITAGLNSENKFLSVIISGALFSIFHMAPNQTLYQFVAGCVFALIVLKGGNFYITFTFHFINNLLIVIFYYFKITYPTLIFTILGLFSLFIGIFILSTNKIKGEKIKDNSSFLKTGVYGIVLCLFMWIVNLFSYMVW